MSKSVGTVKRNTSRGVSAITIAITLPLILLISFSAIDFFLYFRALAVVERAASEAAKAITAVDPGSEGAFSNYAQAPGYTIYGIKSLNGFGQAPVVNSGPHLTLVSPTDVTTPSSTAAPFSLLRYPAETTGVGSPPPAGSGVLHYLPMVYAENIRLDTRNESNPLSNSRLGSFSYQLPSKLDFDGDGREDLVYFRVTPGDDYWILPSSGAGLSYLALTGDVAEIAPSSTILDQPPLPCPADYDGDGKTDLCALTFSSATGSRAIKLNILFSSNFYTKQNPFSIGLGVINADMQVLPVPGQWTGSGKDQFAAIIIGGDSDHHLLTYIWPDFTQTGAAPLSGNQFAIADTPNLALSKLNGTPEPGRNWRPMFGDHDQDGDIDVGWLTWPAGNLTGVIAGSTGTPGRTADDTGKTSKIAPWSLHYPERQDAPGLYITETTNHRISFIAKASGNIVGSDNEKFNIIAGKEVYDQAALSYVIPDPDPLFAGLFSDDPVPVNKYEKGCTKCPGGGTWANDDGALARDAYLNTPKSAIAPGSITYTPTGENFRPLYIADFGNSRVRLVLPPAPDLEVDGSNDATISTVAGGVVGTGVTCPTTVRACSFDESGNRSCSPSATTPSAGAPSVRLFSYTDTDIALGIHPTCVQVRPLSLAYDARNQQLFIADEMGVVLLQTAGSDGFVNGDVTERLFVLAGTYGDNTPKKPPDKRIMGIPYNLQYSNNALYITTSGLSTFPVVNPRDGEYYRGGILKISGGADNTIGTSDDKFENLVGNWTSSSALPTSFTRRPEDDLNFRNPTTAIFFTTAAMCSTCSPRVQGFVASWLNDTAGGQWENALVRVDSFSRGASTLTTTQWLNNLHLNNWSKFAPSTTAKAYQDAVTNLEFSLVPDSSGKLSQARPLGTVPLEAGSGVAISPDLQYLYVAQPRLGNIVAIKLDQDLDNRPDYANSTSEMDADPDGDELDWEEDKAPFAYNANGADGVRRMDTYLDPLMWTHFNPAVVSPLATPNTDRREWWIDHLVDGAGGWTPAQEESLARMFNDSLTSAAVVLGSTTVNAMSDCGIPPSNDGTLAPFLSHHLTLNTDHYRTIGCSYDCPDWDADENKATLASTGLTSTTCGRNLSDPLYADGRKIGIRRGALVLPPDKIKINGNEELSFIDFSGSAKRSPQNRNAVYHDNSLPSQKSIPLISTVVNINQDYCPGNHEIITKNFANLWPALEAYYASEPRGVASPGGGITLETYPQYSCNRSIEVSGTETKVLSLIPDSQVTWAVGSSYTSSLQYGSTTRKLSTGAEGDGDPDSNLGPVARIAYKILENTLPVDQRESDTVERSARVTITRPDSKTAAVEVSYRLKLNPLTSAALGRDFVLIKSKQERKLYHYGQSNFGE
ncbi:hypothetical protein JNK13_00455 [bacterium]|nr:hypothetical protein [bacterium]